MLERLIFATIQGSIALGGVWLICAIGRKLPANVKVWLWRLAMVKMAFTLIVAVPPLRVLPAPVQQMAPAIVSAPAPQVELTEAQFASLMKMAATVPDAPATKPLTA